MSTLIADTSEVDSIPASLRSVPQWVLWKTVSRNGQPTKQPFQPDGKPAKSNDANTWTTFDNALAQFERGGYDGLGFMFADDDPFCGVDLDGCRDPETGEIAGWAKQTIDQLETYAEVSPSGTGVKLYAKGKWPLPNGKNKKLTDVESIVEKAAGIEVYDQKRYFAVTGQRIEGVSIEPQERQEQIDSLAREHWPELFLQSNKSDANGHATDGNVIEQARKYLDTLPPAISGEGGHNRTFHVACVLVVGFGLEREDALALLKEWNESCQPPWTDDELEHKIDDALQEPGERGYMLNRAAKIFPCGLSISYALCGKNGMVTLTAKLNGETIAVDKVDLAKSSAREKFASQICNERPDTDQPTVEAELLNMADEIVNKSANDAEAEAGEQPDSATLLAKMPKAVQAEAREMLEDGNLLERIVGDVAALGVAGERDLIATVYLVGVSRLLPSPLAAIVQGPSSSGKSYIVQQVSKLFPSETVIHATQQTPNSLFYMPPGSLSHRFIVAGERSRAEKDEAAEATRALREMLSSGKLSKLVAMKAHGQIESRLVEQDGPISYVETTTLTNIFDEDANRCILLTTDERCKQTRRIIAKVSTSHTNDMPGIADRIIFRHHAVQRTLQQRQVVIPYAKRLGELFDSERVEARRAFPQLLAMIQASALLHQFQRKVDADGRLLANEDDYQLARRLLAKPFHRLLGGGLSDPARRYFDHLHSWAGEATFSTTEAYEKVRHQFGRKSVGGWLNELADAGLVEQVEPHSGNKPATWRLTGKEPADAANECTTLPTVNELFGTGFSHSDNE